MSDEQKLYELEQALEWAQSAAASLRKDGTAEARTEREREREAEQASREEHARKERAVWSEAWALMRPDAGTTYPVGAILVEVRHLVDRAELAETREALLRSALEVFAEGECEYGDGCPPCAGTWHSQCGPCRAREALTQAVAILKPKPAHEQEIMIVKGVCTTEFRMHTTPPSEPGWYWARLRDDVPPEGVKSPQVVAVVHGGLGKPVVNVVLTPGNWQLDLFDMWSDRLPEPETEVKP